MVREYLEKTRNEFYDSRQGLIEKLTTAENHYKENIKLIQMLEDSSDENYEAFTPREVNSYNKNKIREIKEEQNVRGAHLPFRFSILCNYFAHENHNYPFCSPAFVFITYHNAPVIHTDEYPPPAIPTISGAANSLIELTPRIYRTATMTNVVNVV